VLSHFGMVPAALIGVEVGRFIDAAELMVHGCDWSAPPDANPGVALGLALGLAANAGRDKVTVLASPGIADFGAWLEQLLAESTGKNGRGIVPVDGEPLALPERYGGDRFFVDVALASELDGGHNERILSLERAGHPVVRIALPDAYALGQEFFRWEMATAVAGAVIGIDPFDQPDVEASKVKTRALTAAYETEGRLPEERPFFAGGGLALYADPKNAAALAAAREKSLAGYLSAHFARLKPGDYVALLAYIERSAAHVAALRDLRALIRDKTRAATSVGFGPRFLHSTGQAYKGGPQSGVFLEITWSAPELLVPGRKYAFGTVEMAQARGDYDVLAERGRRLLRVHLGGDPEPGLAALAAAIGQSLL
jgi:transaldolase / glucose-6-phosphate isomerase